MPRSTFLILIAFLSGQAVCVGAENLQPPPESPPGKAQAESVKIGRLFYSPDERAMLDQMRNSNGGKTASPTEQFTLNGIVRRSSGKSTTWINQLPQRENETPQGVAVQPGAASRSSAQLLLPSGKWVNLKAGQTFDATKGKTREGYQDTNAVQP